MIQRHNFMVKHIAGEWCKSEDVAELEAENQELKQVVRILMNNAGADEYLEIRGWLFYADGNYNMQNSGWYHQKKSPRPVLRNTRDAMAYELKKILGGE